MHFVFSCPVEGQRKQYGNLLTEFIERCGSLVEWAKRDLGVEEWIVRVVMKIYEGVLTAVGVPGH